MSAATDGAADDARAHLAWRAAILAAALNAVGSPMELLLASGVVDLPRWAPLSAAAIGVALVVVLLLQRRRPTRAGAAAAFLVNTAAIVAMLFICDARWSTVAAHWQQPFLANKLGALTAALLTPEIAVGAVSIAMYAGAATVQWLLFAPSLRAALPPTEPLATWIFAGFGMALLIGSTRRFALERRLVEQQQAAAAAEALARAFLAVRDFTNTPLQTIESATAAARMLHPEADVQLGQIERALDKMRKLNQLLARHEPNLRWRQDDESFDAASRLEGSGGPARTDKH